MPRLRVVLLIIGTAVLGLIGAVCGAVLAFLLSMVLTIASYSFYSVTLMGFVTVGSVLMGAFTCIRFGFNPLAAWLWRVL